MTDSGNDGIMLSVLAMIEVSGPEKGLRYVADHIPKDVGQIVEIGRKARKPERRGWSFRTPWYELNSDKLDDHICRFVSSHRKLVDVVRQGGQGELVLRLTVCPVGEGDEAKFSCLLSVATVKVIADCDLELQISPEATMPSAPSWPIASK